MDESTSLSAVKDVGIKSDKNARYRRTMEDSHIIIDKFGGVSTNFYVGVYDGHGGRAAVEYIEKNLHKNLERILKEEELVFSAFKNAYTLTDEELGKNNILNSGATCVSAFIRMENSTRKLYVANCGDARAVLSRGGVAARLSYDHKASDADEIKRIQEAGGFVVLNRVNGVLAVTRALGDRSLKAYVTGEPYLTETTLEDSDTHLIVACDGIWDVLTDQEAIDLIKSESSATVMAEKLLKTALSRGSTDNITVVVVIL